MTLDGATRLAVQVRRCLHRDCPSFGRPLRAEAEGRLALPEHEFGLDLIALVGALRYIEHRSTPEIHRALAGRGVAICPRSVTNLLDRYDELLALSLADTARLRRATAAAGRVILAIDGLQPDVGHEVLWALRDCLSGEILLARSLLSSTQDDLARLIAEVKQAHEVPIAGVVSDGQDSIRKAVRKALAGVPHQLCHCHYPPGSGPADLRGRPPRQEGAEEAGPRGPADRAQGRGPRRRGSGGDPGLLRRGAQRLDRRREAAAAGPGAGAGGAAGGGGGEPRQGRAKGGLSPELTRLRSLLSGGLSATAALWTPAAAAYGWVFRAAAILEDVAGRTGAAVKASYRGLLGAMARYAGHAGDLAGALGHFRKVTRSYWPGLFHCYDVAGLPRTDNDLKHLFGAHRYHGRRASGRKVASPGLVVRGSVRLPAALATRLRGEARGEDLAPSDLDAWRRLRAGLERRQAVRAQGRRFRRDPAAYLQELEDALIKGTLPL